MTMPRLSIIPARAATDRALQPRDLQVLCVLGRHTDDLGWCRRSQVKMAAEMACARSTVHLAVERLIKAGYLERHVQETDNGRDSAHLYRVILDPAHSAIETVREPAADLVENPVDGEGNTPADISAPLPTDRHPLPTQDRHPLPTHGSAPINDPSLTTPLNDREKARARDEDRKKIERWVKRVHPSWPSYVSDSVPKAVAAAADLADAERDEAEARIGDYVAAAKVGGRTVLCTFAVYLAERRWEKLPAPKAVPFNEFATPFSKAWSAWVIAHLASSPEEAGKGWPLVQVLYRKAAIRQGHNFGRRWHDLGATFEPVPVQSETFAAWRALFDERQWPWMPDPGAQPVVYLPAGGPGAIDAYAAAVRASAPPDTAERGAA